MTIVIPEEFQEFAFETNTLEELRTLINSLKGVTQCIKITEIPKTIFSEDTNTVVIDCIDKDEITFGGKTIFTIILWMYSKGALGGTALEFLDEELKKELNGFTSDGIERIIASPSGGITWDSVMKCYKRQKNIELTAYREV